MKFRRIIILLPLLYFGINGRCQTFRSDTIKMLCQNWKFLSISHEPESKELLEDWNDWKNKSRFIFFVNKTFKEIFDDEIDAGEWEYDSNKKMIKFKGAEDTFWHLKKISNSRMEVEFLTILDSEKMVSAILIPVKN